MKFPLVASILTLIGIAILCSLGTWQLKRLEWKRDILAVLEKEKRLDASSYSFSEDDLFPEKSESFYFKRGHIDGNMNFLKQIFIEPRTFEGKSGYHWIVPLSMKNGKTVLVNLGWVEKKIPLSPRIENKSYIVAGGLRIPENNSFESKNSVTEDRWFQLNPSEISKAKNIEDIAPVILYAESISPALQDATPVPYSLNIRNNHWQYALFWYAMAAVLAGVFVIRFSGRQTSGQ